jgi:hypothetical protein
MSKPSEVPEMPPPSTLSLDLIQRPGRLILHIVIATTFSSINIAILIEMVGESLLDFYKRRSQVATCVKNTIQKEKKTAYDAKSYKCSRELIRQQCSNYFQKNKARIIEKRKYEKIQMRRKKEGTQRLHHNNHERHRVSTKVTYYKSEKPCHRNLREEQLDLYEQILITIADMIRDQLDKVIWNFSSHLS